MGQLRPSLIPMILCLSVLVLIGCKRGGKTQQGRKSKGDTEFPASIVATNYTLGLFVKQLVDEQGVTVFDLLPVGENPLEWSPSPTQIDEINQTRPLVVVAGTPPEWTAELSRTIKVINVLPDDTVPFQPAANPSQAIIMLAKIRSGIAESLPDVAFKNSVAKFAEQISSYKEKWESLPETSEPPSGLADGAIRPAKQQPFLTLLDQNHQLLSGKSPRRRARNRANQNKSSFTDSILPVIQRTCIDCHNEVDQEGDLNFELFLSEAAASSQPELWEKVAKVIEMGQMPPPNKKSLHLSDTEKDHFYAWNHDLLEKWDSGEMGSDPGRTTLHRLNKNEYNYTIRDLFGLKIRPADNFPADGGGEGGFDNNADALVLPPLLVENYFESARTIVETVYSSQATRSRYLRAIPGPNLSVEQAAEKVLKYWAALIYRKPPDGQELARLVALSVKEFEVKKRYDDAMKMPLYAMLISPDFLYRSTLTEPQEEPALIDDFELASKLSYFLWSSMPDTQLFKLAVGGELQDPEVLETQVKRMLADEKAKSLGMHFGGQWFGWEELRSSTNPDTGKYPQFTFQLRVLFYKESMMSFIDGVQGAHHSISHHGNKPDQLKQLSLINTFYMSQYAYFLERLHSMKEGSSSVLENSVVMMGSSISNGQHHIRINIPVVLGGNAGGRIKGNRHITAGKTPIGALHNSILDKLNIESPIKGNKKFDKL